MKVHPTTANFPGSPFVQSVSLAHSKLQHLDKTHMQLCPQQLGQLNQETSEKLLERWPETKFRLHANVQVLPKHHIFDASKNMQEDINISYIKSLKEINSHIKADIYSYHAGSRICSLEQMKANTNLLADLLEADVAVEGLYPEIDNKWLINSIDEYEWMAHNLFFALDLSHLQIVYQQSRKTIDKNWVLQMMEHPNCKEIHISGNDGKHDNHQKISGNEWWLDILAKAKTKAHIFTEENFKKKAKPYLQLLT